MASPCRCTHVFTSVELDASAAPLLVSLSLQVIGERLAEHEDPHLRQQLKSFIDGSNCGAAVCQAAAGGSGAAAAARPGRLCSCSRHVRCVRTLALCVSCACLALQRRLCNTTPSTVGSHRQLHKQSVSHGWHRDKCQMDKGNQLCPADEQQQGWSHALRSQHGRRQAACASVCWLPPQEVGRHGSDQRNAQTNSEPCAEWHCPAALLGSGGSGWGVGGAQQRGLLHRVFQRCLGGVGDRIGGAAQVKRSSHGCMACMYSRAANAVVERQSVGCHAHVFITDSFHHVSKETNELYFMHPLVQKSTCSPFALLARPLGAACRRLPPLSAGCRRPQVAPCQGSPCSTHDVLEAPARACGPVTWHFQGKEGDWAAPRRSALSARIVCDSRRLQPPFLATWCAGS